MEPSIINYELLLQELQFGQGGGGSVPTLDIYEGETFPVDRTL